MLLVNWETECNVNVYWTSKETNCLVLYLTKQPISASPRWGLLQESCNKLAEQNLISIVKRMLFKLAPLEETTLNK